MSKIIKTTNLIRRQHRVRAKIRGTAACPRLSVRRTNTRMIAQIINDAVGKTLAYSSDFDLTKTAAKATKSERAFMVGKGLGEKAISLKIKTVVFDRHGYLYHGRVKRLAEGAREAGLVF